MLPMSRGVFCLLFRPKNGFCGYTAQSGFSLSVPGHLLLTALLLCIMLTGCAGQQRAHSRALSPEELFLAAQSGHARAQAASTRARKAS